MPGGAASELPPPGPRCPRVARWGCETIVLQSSAMGYAVYEAMGFRTVVRYAIYARR